MEVRIEKLWYSYDGVLGDGGPVLRGVSLRITAGEMIGLVGPSGSGKTTLIQHFTGLLKPKRGRVLVDGVDINRRDVDLVEVRRKIGLVFQFPELQIFEETVWDDVAFGPRNLGLDPDEVDRRVRDALRRTGLEPELFGPRNPHQLSEGERRRVAIAGILAMASEMLILDEPTAGLDPAGVKSLERMLSELHAEGRTVVVVSHHVDFVCRCCKRIVALQDGRVVYDGDRSGFFADEGFLRSIGLELPRLIRWWRKKRADRPELPPEVFSLEDVRRALNYPGR